MAAREQRERPFILQWRSAVLNSRQPSTVKLCLLVLAEWADADGANCYPSIPAIATKACVNEKTVRRSLVHAETIGFIERSHRGTAQGWRRFIYQPTIPEGADSTPARSPQRPDTESAPSTASCRHAAQDVRAQGPERAGRESTDLSITHPINREQKSAGAPSPCDLWNDGIHLLTAAGTKREDAGAAIGKLRKELGEDHAANVVTQMLARKPTGPRAYLFGVINAHAKQHYRGKLPRDSRSEDEIVDALEAELAWMEARA